MILQSIILGIISSMVVSVIIETIHLIIRMSLNKVKLKSIVMSMMSRIGYDATLKKIKNGLIVEEIFTYDQYIYLQEISFFIIGRKKAKKIVETVGQIVNNVNKGNLNINDNIEELNNLFEKY